MPVSEGTPTNQLLFDQYEHDAAGREVRHTTPWNAITQTSYEGLFVRIGDPLLNQTVVEQDPLGRPAGASPFVVAQDYDAYGHVVGVRDSATTLPYWQLTEVDNAGRCQKEAFGNNVTTERSYFPDKQALKSIATEHSGAMAQNLAYDYNVLGNLKSRTDMTPLGLIGCAGCPPPEAV